MKEMLQPDAYIYYSRDNLIFTINIGKDSKAYFMAKSDVCVTNSEFLAKICRKYNPIVTILVRVLT